MFLEAGAYSVEPIGTAEGGAFNSWSAWSFTSCNDPERCVRTRPTTFTGWLNTYHVISPDLAEVSVDGIKLIAKDEDDTLESVFFVTPEQTFYRAADLFVYPNALGALANALPSVFILSKSGTVGFATGDSPSALFDNRGGMSLKVLPVSDVTPVVRPNRGGDTGVVTVRIIGGQFDEDTAVFLRRTGQTEIPGSPVSVEGGGFTIVTTFDLTGQTRGLWDVVVENPDGTIITLEESFTIEEGRDAQVWVDIVGRGVIRPGRPQTFHILYGSRGNVDAFGVPLWISVPADVEITPNFEMEPLVPPNEDDPITLDEVPSTIEVDGQTFIPLFIPRISPGEVSSLQVTVTVPPGRGAFSLKTWASAPFFNGSLSERLDGIQCITGLIRKFLPPGVSCGADVVDEISKILGEIIFSKKVPKIGNLIQSIGTILKGCTRVLEKFSEIETAIKIIVDGILGGIDLGELCSSLVPPPSPPQLPITPVNSLDPNDKCGSLGVGGPRFLSGEEPVRFSVFFENLETATASAQEVVITDQLDTVNMDLSSLSLGPISFGDTIVTPPTGLSNFNMDVDLRPANDLVVRVEASLDKNTGILTWTFASLDPVTGELPADPLAGFLPPNVNPPEGDGSVLFTVMPKENLPTGTEVRNQASIVFDLNEPIVTPEWFNTIDNSKPESEVSPLAATQTSADFEVQWSGTDEGAGIKDFTIFVSEQGGPFSEWLINTSETSGIFSGENGKTYSFYSVARDQTDNSEDIPGTPDATTTVVVEVESGDLDGDSDVDRDDLNILLAARNTPAEGDADPRDLDGDGQITGLDARKLTLLCTRPRCATAE